MREILFRGKSKSVNKGEWIYGSFVEDTNLNACYIRDKSLVYELEIGKPSDNTRA